jgi:hypothetical protein
VLSLNIDSEHTQDMDMMITSDVHVDSKGCDRELFKQHLGEANKLHAPVIIAGDLFDAMQGRYDPRRTPEKLTEKYKVTQYFDALVLDAVDLFKRYKNIPAFIFGEGNHEASVRKHSGTSLIDRLAFHLRLAGFNAISGGYWGYLKIQCNYDKGNTSASKILYWHHGKSSSAVVTKGIIQVSRQGRWLVSPDIILNGHLHTTYTHADKIEIFDPRAMKIRTKLRWWLRTPSYIFSPGELEDVHGFNAEKHRGPLPRGSVFGKFHYNASDSQVSFEPTQKIV